MHTKMAYRQTGSGPILILLHGYAGSVHQWKDLIPELEKKFTVVVPNLTHLYMSRELLTFSEQVDEFADFLRLRFPGKAVHLAGASYGGALAWGLALTHSELVERVVFINPMPPGPLKQIAVKSMRSFFKIPLSPRGVYMFLKTPIGKYFLKRSAFVFRDVRAEHDEWLKNLSGRKLVFVTHVIYKFSWILKSEPWQPWQSRLGFWTHKSFCIYDSEDPLFEKETYLKFGEHIHCKDFLEIKGAGHIAISHCGTEIAQAMLQFLDIK